MLMHVLILSLVGSATALSPYVHAHGPGATEARAAPAGGHLVVTSMLEAGNWAEAQAASRVHLPDWNATALYSGFFEIDAATGSETYFLFSKAVSGREDAPVLLWLNGGPGASSLLGFYDELGPFGIESGAIVPRA